MVGMGNTCLGWSMCVAKHLYIYTLGLQVLVVLEWVESGRVVLVRRSVVLLERSVGLTSSEVGVHLSAEVELGEQSVVGNPVVLGCGLVVPKVLEAGSVGVGEVERHVRVSVVDAVQLLALHEVEHVVLDNWALSVGGVHGSGRLTLDGISEGEDVLESGVLESIGVYIDEAAVVGNAGFNELFVGDGGWVDVGTEEWLFNNFSVVDISEGGDLLSDVVSVDLGHLPSEHDIDASLVALVKGDFVGVGESVDFLVGSPVLDSGTSS